MARLSQTTPVRVLSAGTFPDGQRRVISALVSGCLSLMRSSTNGMPQTLSAIHGLKLHDDRFLSPITSVYLVSAMRPFRHCHVRAPLPLMRQSSPQSRSLRLSDDA